jgi:signal transduction histidine kinase
VQGQVEESIAFEREFATNLGHEIRTALAAIASDAELVLLDDALSPAHRRRLQRQLVNVDAINSSLSSAENLARPFSSTKKHTNIRACVNEAWLAFESMAGRQGLVFVNDVPDSASGWLDPYALLMVARNLIRNAAEHAAPATMTIGMEDENTIVFLDDGPGIPPESLPLIFERFYSAARTDIPAAEDAGPRAPARRGLGLAIAKQVCNRHGWTLNVRSPALPAGRGTAFLLVFS